MNDREFISRPEDMSTDGTLSLIIQEDGDIIVTVRESGEKGFGQSVEFCNSGGHSPHTLKALRHLMDEMRKDTRMPCKMDAYNGPVCHCGQASVHESGLCEYHVLETTYTNEKPK